MILVQVGQVVRSVRSHWSGLVNNNPEAPIVMRSQAGQDSDHPIIQQNYRSATN